MGILSGNLSQASFTGQEICEPRTFTFRTRSPVIVGEDLWFIQRDLYDQEKVVKEKRSEICRKKKDLFYGQDRKELVYAPRFFRSLNDPKKKVLHKDIFNYEVKDKPEEKNYESSLKELAPHSWSFLVDQSILIDYYADNLLSTTAVHTIVRQGLLDSDFNFLFSYDYKRFWPTLSLKYEYFKEVDTYPVLSNGELQTLTLEKHESSLGTTISIPYIFQKRLMRFTHQLIYEYDRGNVISAEVQSTGNEISGFERNTYYQNTLLSILTYQRAKRSLQLYPSYGIDLYAITRQRVFDDLSGETINQSFVKTDIYLPTPFEEDGLKFSLSSEHQGSRFTFRLTSIEESLSNYAFSRGYEYYQNIFYHKGTLDYAFNLAFGGFPTHYICSTTRIWAQLFYDYTEVELLNFEEQNLLRSHGVELYIEGLFFRLSPIRIGLRYTSLLDQIADEDRQNMFEVTLGLNNAF